MSGAARRGETWALRVVPLRALALLLYMAAVVSLSALPGRQIARWGFSPRTLDLLHVPLFAGLALVAQWAIVAPPRVRALLAFAALAIFAGGDEILQRWVPGRVASLADFARDALGIALGIAVSGGARPLALALRRESER